MADVARLIAVLSITVYHSMGSVTQEWNNWSDWSAGPCQGTNRPYTRSRRCDRSISSTAIVSSTSAVDSSCMAGEREFEYRNRTTSSCPQTETVIGLGVVSTVALILILIGIVFSILCVRVWVRRTTYNVRQARHLNEHRDNIPVYHNINLSPSKCTSSQEISGNSIADVEIEQSSTDPCSTAGEIQLASDDHVDGDDQTTILVESSEQCETHF